MNPGQAEGRKHYRSETGGTENRKTIQKINKTKNWFFEKTDKTDTLPARPTN